MDGIWTEPNVSRDAGASYVRPMAIGFGSIIATGSMLLGPLSLGRECHVLAGARIERSAIWDSCQIEPGATIVDSIVGYNCYIATEVRVEGALLGDGVIVRPGAYVARGSRLAPGTIWVECHQGGVTPGHHPSA